MKRIFTVIRKWNRWRVRRWYEWWARDWPHIASEIKMGMHDDVLFGDEED